MGLFELMLKNSHYSEEYLPCPFCGNENLYGPYLTEYIGDSYSPYWWIECRKCPASMQVEGKTDEQLYLAWNSRAC